MSTVLNLIFGPFLDVIIANSFFGLGILFEKNKLDLAIVNYIIVNV